MPPPPSSQKEDALFSISTYFTLNLVDQREMFEVVQGIKLFVNVWK